MRKRPGRKTTWPFGRDGPQQIAGYRRLFSVALFLWWWHHLFVLCASPKSQRRDQNGHDHDHFQKFQSKSPPFAASCSGLFRQGTQREAMLFLSFLSPVADGFIWVAGCPCACGDSLFPLSASTKAQSSGQNGHDHDRLYEFQSISPPFVASCTARVGSHTDNNVFVKFFGCIARRFNPNPSRNLQHYRRLRLCETAPRRSSLTRRERRGSISTRDPGVWSFSNHASITTGVPSSTISNNSITSSLRILTQP